MLDTADKKKDFELGRHIAQVHQRRKVPVNGVFNEEFLKAYISKAKEFSPVIP
jgi:DNA replicative helicase MCM subunit Mcm2 (Cdc46/Mcm family)